MIAAAGGAYRLALSQPRALAIEMLLTGDRLSAECDMALGIVTRLEPTGGALGEALKQATSIAANAPLAERES